MNVVQVLGRSTGGIRVHVATLAAHLRSKGVESPVVGPRGVLDGLGPQAGVVEVPQGLSPSGLLAAGRALRPWREQADLVHAHGLKAAWTCVAGRPRRPLVMTVHNVVIDESAGRTVSLRRRLERGVLRRADRVIAPTRAIAEGLAGVVESSRIRVVVPASPEPVPVRSRTEVRLLRQIDDEVLLVVCVARLHPQKDLPTLLRAWSAVHHEVPRARLVVVGEGPDRAALEALCAELDLGDSVDLVGFDGHAVDWIAAADLVVISSVWEAIPLVLAEAMQLGVPVVSTDVGLASELLGDGAAGEVVPVGDVGSLAAALGRFLTDPALRTAAGAVACERSVARFDERALGDAVLEVYRELLGSSEV